MSINLSVYVKCLNCNSEIECDVVSDEIGRSADIPDTCPYCSEELPDCNYDYREDFCAGT